MATFELIVITNHRKLYVIAHSLFSRSRSSRVEVFNPNLNKWVIREPTFVDDEANYDYHSYIVRAFNVVESPIVSWTESRLVFELDTDHPHEGWTKSLRFSSHPVTLMAISLPMTYDIAPGQGSEKDILGRFPRPGHKSPITFLREHRLVDCGGCKVVVFSSVFRKIFDLLEVAEEKLLFTLDIVHLEKRDNANVAQHLSGGREEERYSSPTLTIVAVQALTSRQPQASRPSLSLFFAEIRNRLDHFEGFVGLEHYRTTKQVLWKIPNSRNLDRE
ncbi:hypothetical protein CRG98_035901 [Punica granatum]|uniref:Uncharacterized protein n=1 Tax=Punica granatum TaxID=22663 RepID=A0A2I0II66_PUNGR|nr:hypothetical protein CRG98_035901 [Punica granatum]